MTGPVPAEPRDGVPRHMAPCGWVVLIMAQMQAQAAPGTAHLPALSLMSIYIVVSSS